jgi:hypothetical protein
VRLALFLNKTSNKFVKDLEFDLADMPVQVYLQYFNNLDEKGYRLVPKI